MTDETIRLRSTDFRPTPMTPAIQAEQLREDAATLEIAANTARAWLKIAQGDCILTQPIPGAERAAKFWAEVLALLEPAPPAADAFTVETDEADGFHYVVETTTGQRVGNAYPLRKTANRAARNLSAKAAPAQVEADEPATSSPLLDGPVTFSDDEPVPTDIPATLVYTPADEGEAPVWFPGLHVEPVAAPAPAKVSPEAASIAAIVTREDWLNAASVLIASIMADKAELELPTYRVTCGWPSKGGTSKKRVLGQCWNPEASDDAHAEVFISPMESDPATVVAILAHELIHAALPKGTGHKGPFVKAAKALGFLAPFTQLVTSEELDAWVADMVAALPAYPHARLNPAAEGEKKTQTTRMLKAVCEADHEGEACGYQVRLTRKWIEEVGAPICPRHHEPMTCEGLEPAGDEPEGEGEDDEIQDRRDGEFERQGWAA